MRYNTGRLGLPADRVEKLPSFGLDRGFESTMESSTDNRLLIYFLISWKNFPIVVHKSTHHTTLKFQSGARPPQAGLFNQVFTSAPRRKRILNMLANTSSYPRVVTISEDAGFQSGIMEAIASKKTGLQMSNKMKRE
jgi:hypothetical protein